jgi:RNA polymerase sigma-70 factor (ECF subfamily)
MNGKPGEDELLVLRSRQGDPEALDTLLRKWQQPLWAYAFRMTGNQDASYDVLQETLISIARDLNRLQSDSAFGAWAYQIARNKATDWLRQNCKRQKRENAFAEEKLAEAADGTEPGIQQGILSEFLAKLADPGERALLLLRFEQGFTHQEIASMLDIPVGTVKSRMHTVITQLRSKIKGNL